MRIPLSHRRRDDGAVAIMTAILATALLVMCAFTVDFGMAYTTKRQLSTAADAASLAATTVYKNEFSGSCSSGALTSQTTVRANAEVAADSMFRANYPQGVDSDGNITTVQCNGTGVQVVYAATGKSDSPFGKLAGGSGTLTTQGEAAAAYSVSGKCSMCFLGGVDVGNSDFSATGGNIHVNGGIEANPQSYWTGSGISIACTPVTAAPCPSSADGNFTPGWTVGPIIPDPYVSIFPLSVSGLQAKTNPCADGPGIYSSVVNIPNSCILLPGPYVVRDHWNWGNNSMLTGTNVTLYVEGPNGQLHFKNGGVDFSAPASHPALGWPIPSLGWPAKFAIIYDPLNTNSLQIQGNGDINVKGIVYLPSSVIEYNGNSTLRVDSGAVVALGASTVGNTSGIALTNPLVASSGVPAGLRLTK